MGGGKIMANKRSVDKSNPNNVYCDHCKHYKKEWAQCDNPESKYYTEQRYYYHRCKEFEWKE